MLLCIKSWKKMWQQKTQVFNSVIPPITSLRSINRNVSNFPVFSPLLAQIFDFFLKSHPFSPLVQVLEPNQGYVQKIILYNHKELDCDADVFPSCRVYLLRSAFGTKYLGLWRFFGWNQAFYDYNLYRLGLLLEFFHLYQHACLRERV